MRKLSRQLLKKYQKEQKIKLWKIKHLNDEQLSRLIMDDLQHEIAVVSETLQTMKPNMGAIEEYRRKEKDYKEHMAELDTVTETRDSAKTKLESLRKQRLDEFMTHLLGTCDNHRD